MRFVLSAIMMIAAMTAAFAIDFSSPITQLDGQPFIDKDGKPIHTTLAIVAENALLASYQDEQNLSGEDKVKRFVLAHKIHDDEKNVELTADEITLIKKLIAKSYNPLITGESWRILDPASIPK